MRSALFWDFTQHGISGERRPHVMNWLVLKLIFWLANIAGNLYRCTAHLDMNFYVQQLMHLFISPREH
jgi:hypothetical protein